MKSQYWLPDTPPIRPRLPMRVRADQRGITGLETAIVLIAFVVVASVFAFAILTTGLISSEESKEAVLGALEETQSTVSLRGAVVAHATTSLASIDHVTFQVANVAQTAEAVDLSENGTIVAYTDPDNHVGSFTHRGTPPTTTTVGWNATWLSGVGPLLQVGERVEVTVNLTGLSTPLATAKRFTVEVRPSQGAVLSIQRTTPGELTPVLNLE